MGCVESVSREAMQARIAELETQGVLDRALIEELRVQASYDRKEVERLLADAVLSEDEIGRLSEVVQMDRATIQSLMVDVALGQREKAELRDAHTSELAENEELHAALVSCRIIGAAVGVAMERYGLDQEAAFLYLARLSQTSNRKLRDLAGEFVAESKSD